MARHADQEPQLAGSLEDAPVLLLEFAGQDLTVVSANRMIRAMIGQQNAGMIGRTGHCCAVPARCGHWLDWTHPLLRSRQRAGRRSGLASLTRQPGISVTLAPVIRCR